MRRSWTRMPRRSLGACHQNRLPNWMGGCSRLEAYGLAASCSTAKKARSGCATLRSKSSVACRVLQSSPTMDQWLGLSPQALAQETKTIQLVPNPDSTLTFQQGFCGTRSRKGRARGKPTPLANLCVIFRTSPARAPGRGHHSAIMRLVYCT